MNLQDIKIVIDETIKEIKQSEPPLFFSFSLLDNSLNCNSLIIGEVFISQTGTIVVKQGGHLRTIHAIKDSLFYYIHNYKEKENEKFRQIIENTKMKSPITLFKYELINNSIRDAILHSFILKIKDRASKNYELVLRNTLPILNQWLGGLELPYAPTSANFHGKVDGKDIDYRKLKICIQCFKEFTTKIPNNHLCKSNGTYYTANCKKRFVKWIGKLSKSHINAARSKLFIFINSRFTYNTLDKVQEIIDDLAKTFSRKILAERGFSTEEFLPFVSIESDKYYSPDDKSNLYRDLTTGIKNGNNDIVLKLIKKYKLKGYETQRLLYKDFYMRNLERVESSDQELFGLIQSIFPNNSCKSNVKEPF